jgi:6-phosphofructokinase 1
MMRRVGILTAGRDAPGMNAIIRSVGRSAFDRNYELVGFRNGFDGLTSNDAFVMNKETVSGILHLGGTILGTSTGNPFELDINIQKAKKNIAELSITSLIIIGGFKYMQRSFLLSEAGIPIIGIPASIDNNIPYTDLSVGFLTAADYVASSLDILHSTASAHHRIFLVEVMGGGAGWIGVIGGLTGGADLILVPERNYSIEEIVNHIENRKSNGKNFSIIVASDEVKAPIDMVKKYNLNLSNTTILDVLCHEIEEKGNEVRKLILGHLQRGGSPKVTDRLLATMMGHQAIELIHEGVTSHMITFSNGVIGRVPLSMIQQPKMVNPDMLSLAKIFY